jgi:prevent-host-death family protein
VAVFARPLPRSRETLYGLSGFQGSGRRRNRVSFDLEVLVPSASVSDVSRNLAQYVDRVAREGERITLVRRGRPVAELVPVPRGVPVRDLPALFAALPRLTPAEADEFARDLEDVRAQMNAESCQDPWES